jgi:hypothetical protein
MRLGQDERIAQRTAPRVWRAKLRRYQNRKADLTFSFFRWEDGSVHQNLTFPVEPDFISGRHCWH